jgi:lipoprotein-anchoring transpeptidase ErfK/SrfK
VDPVTSFVLIDRENFTLRLYRRSKTRLGRYALHKYPIAIGKAGDATPAGLYYVDAKNREPAWKIPEHEDYHPSWWGQIIPFEDPANPFAGGFISLSGGEGIGIHGTKFDPKLGTRASHGCIRLATDDLDAIWDRIDIGTPVLVR